MRLRWGYDSLPQRMQIFLMYPFIQPLMDKSIHSLHDATNVIQMECTKSVNEKEISNIQQFRMLKTLLVLIAHFFYFVEPFNFVLPPFPIIALKKKMYLE